MGYYLLTADRPKLYDHYSTLYWYSRIPPEMPNAYSTINDSKSLFHHKNSLVSPPMSTHCKDINKHPLLRPLRVRSNDSLASKDPYPHHTVHNKSSQCSHHHHNRNNNSHSLYISN
ncbi:hypothetical protein L873DRAFT_1819017 [Choiromyces venosus 120613-1]|uniref:Uncharacterized protein n=1 Tax=Choiromyces venosus 120613-1 TaxID=1336337 RepID=A0A3N4IZN5_9PEZI|nr:hypothetical protein L873DRAFT_1819017 [Choiromyces venosus 120613-1]